MSPARAVSVMPTSSHVRGGAQAHRGVLSPQDGEKSGDAAVKRLLADEGGCASVQER